MGVAASGKSSVGQQLATQLGARFVEGDTHHLSSSVAKMAAGIALTDDDRWPWLIRLQRELASATDDQPVVVSCSALKRSYRDLLRHAGDVRFVFLDVTPSVLVTRIAERAGHFMNASMLESQLATLETPGTDEGDVIIVDGDAPIDDIVERIVRALTTKSNE